MAHLQSFTMHMLDFHKLYMEIPMPKREELSKWFQFTLHQIPD